MTNYEILRIMNQILRRMKMFKFMDLFAGIGGFHLALKDFGGQCVFASEIDKHCQEVYEDNFGIKPVGDITKITEDQLPPEVDVVCGGFPCQPFSLLGYKKGFKDIRGTMFFEIVRILKHYISINKPVRIVLLENVVNLLWHDNGNTWKTIRHSLRELGYELRDEPYVLSPDDLGIPQIRPRVFILAIWKGFLWEDYKLPAQKDLDALKRNLSVLGAYLEDNPRPAWRIPPKMAKSLEVWDKFFNLLGDEVPHFLLMPETWEHTYEEPTNTRPYLHTIIKRNQDWYQEHKELCDKWMEEVNFKGLKFIIPKTYLQLRLSDYNSRSIWNYTILSRPNGWRLSSPWKISTITAQGNISIVGSRKRYLTPRELANFQSFPKDFKLSPYKAVCHKQLGNAVNVDCVKAIFSLLPEKLISNS